MRTTTRKPEPCLGGGQPARHTYEIRERTSGGGERPAVRANCPVDHDRHYDLGVTPAGNVYPHAK